MLQEEFLFKLEFPFTPAWKEQVWNLLNPFLCPVEMVTLVDFWVGGLIEFTGFFKTDEHYAENAKYA